jgi:putative endonuclease
MGSPRFAARARTGQRAEALASELLERRGLRIVARNWRRPEGELDLVADDGGTCVFVEVRSRTGEERGHPLESITPQKRARIIRAARLYIDSAEAPASGYRFDVVGVTFPADGDGGEPVLVYIPDAFDLTFGAG